MFWSRFPQYNYNIKAHISIIVSETCPVEGHALFIKVLLNVTTYSSDLWKWKKSIHKDIQFFFEKLVWKATDQNSVSPYRHTKCQHTKAWSCRSCDFPFKTSSNFKLERTVKQAKQTGHHIRLNNSRNGEIYRSYGNFGSFGMLQ